MFFFFRFCSWFSFFARENPPSSRQMLRRSERLRQKEERGREVRSRVIDSLPHSEGLNPVDFVENISTSGNMHPSLLALRGGPGANFTITSNNLDVLNTKVDHRQTLEAERSVELILYRPFWNWPFAEFWWWCRNDAAQLSTGDLLCFHDYLS